MGPKKRGPQSAKKTDASKLSQKDARRSKPEGRDVRAKRNNLKHMKFAPAPIVDSFFEEVYAEPFPGFLAYYYGEFVANKIKTKFARTRRVNIRKRKKAMRETLRMLRTPADPNEFACFVATDSEPEPDDYLDDRESVENIREDEPIPNIQTIRNDGLEYVRPGLLDNGYYDDGDPLYVCEHCYAYMWHGERLGRRYKYGRPVFSLCCMQGKVKLPLLKSPPNRLLELLYNPGDRSKHFRKCVRAYNMLFSFTSLGGKVNHSINNGKGPYVFQLSGENFHRIGDLLPQEGVVPSFMQLYIHDTDNEVGNRISAYGKKGSDGVLREDVVTDLKNMLDKYNPHVKAFRFARDKIIEGGGGQSFKLVLTDARRRDGRTYNLPTANEVAALIPGDFNYTLEPRDVVIQCKTGQLQRISELHPSYLPLQYPLLFPYGEDGFRLGIDIGFVDLNGRKRTTITMREFFAFRIQERCFEAPTIIFSGRLYQQFLVDVYTMVEMNRLRYVSLNQGKLRSENYNTLSALAENQDVDLSDQGKRIFIPSSYTGGPRYMFQHYLDAMATCKFYGFPDLFITMTCNPKWPEITRYLDRYGLTNEDRPDICCRVFKIKLENLMDDLTRNFVLGVVVSALYTIEFQKRGLPHAHIVLFMAPGSKLPSGDEIDKIICAELPDKDTDPYLYEVVSDVMIHGPCGELNMNSVCMEDGKCSKFFPKSFSDVTKIDDAGYPIYRRRNDGRSVMRMNRICDNTFVVPYNRVLSVRYRAHINVEWCIQSKSIKYLFKYISKGPDYVRASLVQQSDDKKEPVNEVKLHYSCRYVSSCEATWRILGFCTQFRTTPVERLSFHLPGQQQVIYNEDDPVDEVIGRNSVCRTKFIAWMEANKRYPAVAKGLTYANFPSRFVWVLKTREWRPRSRGFAIGRLTYVPPIMGEVYYLRVLLNVVTHAPTCFEEIRTVDNVVYETFKDACNALGLLKDDKEYIDAITEASYFCSGKYIRRLFVIMLLSNSMSKPSHVWSVTSHILSEDMLYELAKRWKQPGLKLTPEQILSYTLVELEDMLRLNGSTMTRFSDMPIIDEMLLESLENALIRDEKSYDRDDLRKKHAKWIATITDEHRAIYDQILKAVDEDLGGMYFLYGYGGTGKTYLWSLLGSVIRARGEIVLNVASSGIAALLLQGGRTAHSRFAIPIIVNETSTCSIKADSDIAGLIRETRLIIWDEAPMMSKLCFETLDRSMRDIMKCDRPFGGKVIVLGGDFRQILPVIPDAGRVETVMATINSSRLWQHCTVLELTENMRLRRGRDVLENEKLATFSKWILDLGDGKINPTPTGDSEIEIPDDLLIKGCDSPIRAIVHDVYGKSFASKINPEFYQERAILCPKNQDVDVINDYMMSQLAGREMTFLSADCIETSDTSTSDDMVYSDEF